ncbi:hypothetical protein QYE76_051498, partial [Lolium multiflorum]
IAGGIGCKVFKWIDDPLDARHKELVRDLRDAVWDRDEEIERLQVEIERLQEEKFLLAARKQSNPEPKKMGGFMVWVLSVAFVICSATFARRRRPYMVAGVSHARRRRPYMVAGVSH